MIWFATCIRPLTEPYGQGGRAYSQLQIFTISVQTLFYQFDPTHWSDGRTAETEIEQSETDLMSHSRVRRAIDSLPKRQQEVVFLKFYQGLENDQIAAQMGINRQSVANLLYKALCSLKQQVALFRYWLIALIVLA